MAAKIRGLQVKLITAWLRGDLSQVSLVWCSVTHNYFIPWQTALRQQSLFSFKGERTDSLSHSSMRRVKERCHSPSVVVRGGSYSCLGNVYPAVGKRQGETRRDGSPPRESISTYKYPNAWHSFDVDLTSPLGKSTRTERDGRHAVLLELTDYRRLRSLSDHRSWTSIGVEH